VYNNEGVSQGIAGCSTRQAAKRRQQVRLLLPLRGSRIRIHSFSWAGALRLIAGRVMFFWLWCGRPHAGSGKNVVGNQGGLDTTCAPTWCYNGLAQSKPIRSVA